MPAFTYVGTEERVYPDLGLTVAPGDEVTVKDNPDEVRFVKAAAKTKASPAPDAPAS